MTQSSSAKHIVRDAVSSADQWRRSQEAKRVVAKTAVVEAVFVLLTAVVGRIAGWSPRVTIGISLVLAASLIAMFISARRRHVPTDAMAAKVDADAQLAGELRSAHWFASTDVQDAWTLFHLERAADRLRIMNWSEIYPEVSVRRPWLTAGCVCALALALPLTLPAWHGAAPSPPPASSAATPPMSPELRQSVLAVANAMQIGLVPLDDVLAAVGQIMDTNGMDASLRKQIDDLLKQVGSSGAADAQSGNAMSSSGLAATKGPKTPQAMTDAMRQALGQLAEDVAKESAQRNKKEDQADKGGDKTPAKNSTQGDPAAARSQAVEQREDMSADASHQNDTGDAADEIVMEDDDVTGEAYVGPSIPNGEANEIAAALKLELIEAKKNSDGSDIKNEDRRRMTEEGRSTMTYTSVDGLATFDRAHGAPPPAVPESRRPLLERYFVRPATPSDSGTTGSKAADPHP